MMALLIIFAGTLAGMIPGVFGRDRLFSTANIVVGIAGAVTGAFLGFGDAPLFLKYPFLNEKSLMILAALLFVLIKISVAGNQATRGNRR